MSTDGVDGDRHMLRGTRMSQLALVALDDALKRVVKRGHDAELLAFIRGAAPPPLPVTSQATPPSSCNSATNVPRKPLLAGVEEYGNEPRGLPLLLAALESSPRPSDPEGNGGGRQGSVIQWYPSSIRGVSAVHTCARAASDDEQDAMLSRLVLPRLEAAAVVDNSAAIGAGSGLAGKPLSVSVMSAIVGAIRLESKVFGEQGIAAAVVPVLLKGALAEGSAGLGYDGEGNNAGVALVEAVAPFCQCLAAVLNKLSPGSSLDSSVGLVIEVLRKAFGTEVGPVNGVGGEVEGADDMEVDGRQKGGGWPVQCLAWVTKAVAMRGGLSTASSELLEMLCMLVLVGAGDLFLLARYFTPLEGRGRWREDNLVFVKCCVRPRRWAVRSSVCLPFVDFVTVRCSLLNSR